MINLQTKILRKWEELEKNNKLPSEINKVNEIEYKEFFQLFENSNFKKIEQLMEEFYLGSIFVVRNSFSKKFIEKVKSYLISNFDNADSTFHKTKEGCPNFHRIIGEFCAQNTPLLRLKNRFCNDRVIERNGPIWCKVHVFFRPKNKKSSWCVHTMSRVWGGGGYFFQCV